MNSSSRRSISLSITLMSQGSKRKKNSMSKNKNRRYHTSFFFSSSVLITRSRDGRGRSEWIDSIIEGHRERVMGVDRSVHAVTRRQITGPFTKRPAGRTGREAVKRHDTTSHRKQVKFNSNHSRLLAIINLIIKKDSWQESSHSGHNMRGLQIEPRIEEWENHI